MELTYFALKQAQTKYFMMNSPKKSEWEISHGSKDPVSLNSRKSTVRNGCNVGQQLVQHEAWEKNNNTDLMCTALLADEL